MGDVVLGELLKARAVAPGAAGSLDAFLVAVTAEDTPAVLQLAHALRDRGGRVEFSLKEQSIAKQLKLASARGARFAVIIGPEERQRGGAVVRDLRRGEERAVSAAELAGDAVLGGR
ncbi:MAG: hypothetical protein HYW52_05990 [Gemmatimonadetes bacterium]|nr:hypothetical protein [Gemmatimonadota bacterium]